MTNPPHLRTHAEVQRDLAAARTNVPALIAALREARTLLFRWVENPNSTELEDGQCFFCDGYGPHDPPRERYVHDSVCLHSATKRHLGIG